MNFSDNAILEDNDLYLFYPNEKIMTQNNDNILSLLLFFFLYLLIYIFGFDMLL